MPSWVNFFCQPNKHRLTLFTFFSFFSTRAAEASTTHFSLLSSWTLFHVYQPYFLFGNYLVMPLGHSFFSYWFIIISYFTRLFFAIPFVSWHEIYMTCPPLILMTTCAGRQAGIQNIYIYSILFLYNLFSELEQKAIFFLATVCKSRFIFQFSYLRNNLGIF